MQNPGENKCERSQVLWFGGTKGPRNRYPTCSCPRCGQFHYAFNSALSIQINVSEPAAAAQPEPQTRHSLLQRCSLPWKPLHAYSNYPNNCARGQYRSPICPVIHSPHDGADPTAADDHAVSEVWPEQQFDYSPHSD